MRDWTRTKHRRLAADVESTEIAGFGQLRPPVQPWRTETDQAHPAVGHDFGQIRYFPADSVSRFSGELPPGWSAEPLSESDSGQPGPTAALAGISTLDDDRDAKLDDEDEEEEQQLAQSESGESASAEQSGSAEASSETSESRQGESAGAETAESGQSEEAGAVKPVEGEPVVHCGPEEQEEEGGVAADREDAAGSDPASASRLGVRARLAVVGETEQGQPADGNRHSDAVKGTLTSGSSVTKGGVTLAATSFGEEAAKFSIDGITYKVGKAAVDVAGRTFVDCKWDTQSRGRTDVSDAAGASVTDATWKAVETDLTPNAKGIPKRKTYWASDLTSKHERFHASDDIGRAALYRPTAETWLSKQTVDPKNAKSEVADLMEKARDMIKADNWAWYHAGGEDRAYADGKSSYEARVKDVRDRATKEKWK